MDYLYIHRILIWREKKLDQFRTVFSSTSGYCDPEVGIIFVNIFSNTKRFSKRFWGFTLGARVFQFLQKTRHQKSHAGVPLTNFDLQLQFISKRKWWILECIHIMVFLISAVKSKAFYSFLLLPGFAFIYLYKQIFLFNAAVLFISSVFVVFLFIVQKSFFYLTYYFHYYSRGV